MKSIVLISVAAVTSLLMAGCVQQAGVHYGDGPHHSRPGPPPHAPAHGYRAKYHGHNMRYDSRLGAYVVVGMTDHYFHNSLYLRYWDGAWQVNANLTDKGWKYANRRDIPPRLYQSKGGHGPQGGPPGQQRR